MPRRSVIYCKTYVLWNLTFKILRKINTSVCTCQHFLFKNIIYFHFKNLEYFFIICGTSNILLSTVAYKLILFPDLWAPGLGSLCGGAQIVLDAARCCQMLREDPRCCQMLPAQMLPDAVRCSQMLPDDPRCHRFSKISSS